MKKFNELTSEDCQNFLDELFEDEHVIFKRVVEEDSPGIEYDAHEYTDNISISNPELLCWMYKNKVDLTIPLNNLKYEYNEMNETNSVLFEYAMDIKKILNEYSDVFNTKRESKNEFFDQEMGPTYAKEIEMIIKLQKELITKL